MEKTPRGPAKPMKSLLYWRKSMINGAKTVPVILALDATGALSMWDAAGQAVLSLPAHQASFRFTGMGTMVITAQGRKYDIVGVGASLSPRPSQGQLAEMSAGGHPNRTGLSRAGAAGAAMSGAGAAGAVAGVAGSAAMVFAYHQGVEAIKVWQEILPETGAAVQRNSMKAGPYLMLGLVAAIVLVIIVSLVLR